MLNVEVVDHVSCARAVQALSESRPREAKNPALNLEPNQIQELGKDRVMGIRVFVLATLTLEGELLALVTAQRPSKALVMYGRRWGIECLFTALKTRGFNLEDSHVTDATRAER